MKTVLLPAFMFLTVSAFAQNDDFHLDKEYAISQTGTIDLRSSDADVLITGSERTATARVKIDRTVTVKGWYSSKGSFRVDVRTENGNLIVHEHQTSVNVGIVGYYNEDYKILIEAPEGISLTVRGDDGDYLIKNIGGAISLSADDADVKLTQCSGSNFSFKLDDGDLKMDSGKGTLQLVADDADVEILNAAFNSLRADIDDGDFIVHTSLANEGNYSIDLQDGHVMLNVLTGGGDFSVHHDDASVSANGLFKTIEESEDFSRFLLQNGSAKVSIHADDANVKLVAK